MKARIPPKNKISKKAYEELQTMARQLALEEVNKQKLEYLRQLHKIYAFAFYQTRRGKSYPIVHAKVEELYKQGIEDPCFWYKIDAELIDKRGLDFKREDYAIADDKRAKLAGMIK